MTLPSSPGFSVMKLIGPLFVSSAIFCHYANVQMTERASRFLKLKARPYFIFLTKKTRIQTSKPEVQNYYITSGLWDSFLWCSIDGDLRSSLPAMACFLILCWNYVAATLLCELFLQVFILQSPKYFFNPVKKCTRKKTDLKIDL